LWYAEEWVYFIEIGLWDKGATCLLNLVFFMIHGNLQEATDYFEVSLGNKGKHMGPGLSLSRANLHNVTLA
jgi:hypothetical protein